MKNNLTIIFILSVLSCWGNTALAARWDNNGVTTTIKAVTVLQNGAFYVTAAVDICDAGKVNKTGYVYKNQEPGGIKQTTEGINMLLSVALTAQVTQNKVTLYADDSNSHYGCKLGAIKVAN